MSLLLAIGTNLRRGDGVAAGASWDCSVFGAVLGRSPSVLPSSVLPAAALALLADDRCRSIGVCALSLCSASAQTDPRLEILARTSLLAGGPARESGPSGPQPYA